MSNKNAREFSGQTDRISRLGARDANRELYRAAHPGKRARRFVTVAVSKSSK